MNCHHFQGFGPVNFASDQSAVPCCTRRRGRVPQVPTRQFHYHRGKLDFAETNRVNWAHEAESGALDARLLITLSCLIDTADSEGIALDGGGESGIRTHVRVSPKHAFQACAFNHSAISPSRNFSSSLPKGAAHRIWRGTGRLFPLFRR